MIASCSACSGDGNIAGHGEIVGGAERQDAQYRPVVRRQLHQRGGHFVDGAVTAAGDDGADAELCGFRDVARGVAVLPGHAHVQRDLLCTQAFDRLTQLFVTGAFAVENKQGGRM